MHLDLQEEDAEGGTRISLGAIKVRGFCSCAVGRTWSLREALRRHVSIEHAQFVAID